MIETMIAMKDVEIGTKTPIAKIDAKKKMWRINMNKYKNICLHCGCYDEDMGCTMPSVDKMYACELEARLQADEVEDD